MTDYNGVKSDREIHSLPPNGRAGQRAGARATAVKRQTGRRLQASRFRLLSKTPLCVMCQTRGKITVAVHRDHIVALANGGTDTDDNTQALCMECHREKTAKDLGLRYRPPTPVSGW